MAETKDYKRMTVEEFIETQLFIDCVDDVLNDLLHGYNEIGREASAVGKKMKKAPLINLVEEGLLDDTTKFIQEYYKVLAKMSERTAGERTTIRGIGNEALHKAVASLAPKNKSNGEKS